MQTSGFHVNQKKAVIALTKQPMIFKGEKD